MSDEQFLSDVRHELGRAREKFPGNEHQAAALTEESGEVLKALLQHTHEGGEAGEVYNECVQTAAMAVRVAVEGDHSFPYDPGEILDGVSGQPSKGTEYRADLDSRYLEAHQVERRQSPVRFHHDDGTMEERLAMVRESDLAALEERAARQEAELEDHRLQSDTPIEISHMLREELGLGPEHSLVDHVHQIKAERDKLNDERDIFAQRATLFRTRAEKAEADRDYLLDALKRANSLAFQAYTAASRANEGIQHWLDDYPNHSGAGLEDPGEEETVAQGEDAEHNPYQVTIPAWAAQELIRSAKGSFTHHVLPDAKEAENVVREALEGCGGVCV